MDLELYIKILSQYVIDQHISANLSATLNWKKMVIIDQKVSCPSCG